MSVTINQGLKNYQEAITHNIGSLRNTINLCPAASNIVVEIPLFNALGVEVMSSSWQFIYWIGGII
jgi:hypothetical protein